MVGKTGSEAAKMGEEQVVKLFQTWSSPFSLRVVHALATKGDPILFHHRGLLRQGKEG